MSKQDKVEKFLRSVTSRAFAFMNPELTNYRHFSERLAKQIQVKAGENIQYGFDVELDRLVREELEQAGVTGRIFSEESEWFDLGEPEFKVVYDPLCNSTLASRSLLDAALGVSVFSYAGEWLASVVLDYQTGLVGLADGAGVKFFQVQTWERIEIERSRVTELEKAWVVLTLESRDERMHVAEASEIMARAKRVISCSGHIYWLRLAAGNVDGYLDPFGGEGLYEMFACTLALGAGCVVTDTAGAAFDPAMQLKRFEADRSARFYPVAAATEQLHAQLLRGLKRP